MYSFVIVLNKVKNVFMYTDLSEELKREIRRKITKMEDIYTLYQCNHFFIYNSVNKRIRHGSLFKRPHEEKKCDLSLRTAKHKTNLLNNYYHLLVHSRLFLY